MVDCKNRWAITTSKARGKHGLGLSEDAETLAMELNIPILLRDNKGIGKLMQQHELDVLLIEEDDCLTAHWLDGQSLTYHPGMSVPRIKHIKDGEQEMLATVMDLSLGNAVLDCTMGMASDAVTVSFLVGEFGSVTALESSEVIYAITRYGLRHWHTDSVPMRQAMKRVQPMHVNYEQYLNDLAKTDSKAFDIIYFDPMFERPIMESSGIAPLRKEADYAPLTQEILELARTLCKKRVVVKHRVGTLNHLEFDARLGGKYSNLAYGVLYAKTDGV